MDWVRSITVRIKSSAVSMSGLWDQVCRAAEALKEMVGFSVVPFLVVIRMTPLAEREPKAAALLASFKTSIVAMSAGLISLTPPM